MSNEMPESLICHLLSIRSRLAVRSAIPAAASFAANFEKKANRVRFPACFTTLSISRSPASANHVLQYGDHIPVVREEAGLRLGVDFVAVGVNIEDAAAPADQLRFDAGLLLDVSRQTGGPRTVVSLHAVLDGHFHRCPLLPLSLIIYTVTPGGQKK